MAKQLKSFDFSGTQGSKWNWDLWLNGEIWQLDKEDLGDAKLDTMRSLIMAAAERRELKVQVAVNKKEHTIALQSRPMTAEELEAHMAKIAARKVKEEVEEQKDPNESEEPLTDLEREEQEAMLKELEQADQAQDEVLYDQYKAEQEAAGKKPKSFKNWKKSQSQE